MTNQNYQPLLKPRDAAKWLSVSRSTLRRLVATDRLPPPVRLSERRIAFRPEDQDALCAASRRGC